MRDETVKELTDLLESGVKEIFESEKYAQYLKTMSCFHNYSTRNITLIHIQYPSAKRVASFLSWKNNFNRSVNKGEHAIKIFAPIAKKDKDIEVEKLDPVTQKPVLDENGRPIMERLMPVSNLQMRFKLVNVFDVGQTSGDPLPELAETLTGDVDRYELFMDALRAVSPLPIEFASLPENIDGLCIFGDKIEIREGMSQIQTVSAVIHEIAHSRIHDIETITQNGEEPKDSRQQECEAESISYVVASRFGVDTGANAFGYLASWAKTRELKELNASLDTIRKASASLIDAIDENYKALAKERGIDLTTAAVEMSTEQNYNMIDGIINNEPPKHEEEARETVETDIFKEKLAALADLPDMDEKHRLAADALTDAFCGNEQLIALANTGEGWQQNVGRKAVFGGDYYETLIEKYREELADLLDGETRETKLSNEVKWEAYRHLDAIAFDRFILNDYADITKSGRLETYEVLYPEDSGNKGVQVFLTEQLPDGGKHDYGKIFDYDPESNRDHAINTHLSSIGFHSLRESVFGKPKTAITLNYRETAAVGDTVLRPLLFDDMNFNRTNKRSRVEVLPPMGKYSVYAQHLSGAAGGDTAIHVGTDSGYLLPLGVNRENYEKNYFEAYIDYLFEKAPKQLDAQIADPNKFAMYQQAAMAGRIADAEAHNAVYKGVKAEEDKVSHAEIAEQQATAGKEKKRLHTEQLKTNAGIIESGGRFNVETSQYSGKNNLLELFSLYGVDVPLATKGWFNRKLASFEATANGYSYSSYRNKRHKTSYMGDSAYKKLDELRAAIKAVPIIAKLTEKGLIEMRNEPKPPMQEEQKSSKEEQTSVQYSEFQQRGFETAREFEHLPLQVRLNIIAETFGCKTASVETRPCTGKYRGTSDISIKFDNGESLPVGNERTPEAKKTSVISERVNNTLARYNPQTVAEAKRLAGIALLEQETKDNAVAAEQGLKPYKFLNVELSDGSDGKRAGYLGWYYVTLEVDGRIFGHLTTNLDSDISRGTVGEDFNGRNYFVAGGIKEADYVFNKVGHSTASESYKMELTPEVLEHAKETLARREQFGMALSEMKAPETKPSKTAENRLFDKLTELFPDFMSGKYSYLKLESPGMEPLSLEWIGADTISIMHTYVQDGDLCYDPMMTFKALNNALLPQSFEQSMPPLYQERQDGGEWLSVDGNGNQRTLRNLGAELTDFSKQWFKNIEEQGYTPVRGTLVRGDDDEIRIEFDKDGNVIMPEPEHIEESGKPKQAEIDLSLPDPTITAADRDAYGYTYDGMLPMSTGRAIELFDTGHPIFLLYPDGTEAMAIDRDEVRLFDGLCGIEREDWERSPVYKAQLEIAGSGKIGESVRESELIHNRDSMFGIYQIKDDISEARNFRFASLKELEALGLTVDRANYELVYSAPLMQRFFHGMLNDTDKTLETLFECFNGSQPPDYSARSVSVSDVIVLQQGGEVSAHFVDSAGFKELPTFTGNERKQPQTLSQIDTTLPTVAELEADVKAGKSISVLDLAKAVKREQQKPAPKSGYSLLEDIAETKKQIARVKPAETPSADKTNHREV